MSKLTVKDLTLREKIGQTCVFRQWQLRNMKSIETIEEYFTNNPAGFIWPSHITDDMYMVTEPVHGNPDLKGKKDDWQINLINTLNKYMRVPIMPVTDAGITGEFTDHGQFPAVASLGGANDTELAYKYGHTQGRDLHAIGFRWLWSPVADNPGHFTETRTMSNDREVNGKLMSAFIKGVQDAGVMACVKHFPGHDPYDTRDTHFCTSGYFQSLKEWNATQRKDFQACIDAGVDSVMIRHATFEDVDDTRVNDVLLPATVSHKIVTGLLREEMGFKGVVVTDDMTMKAMTAVYPDAKKLYVETLKAGVDVILGPVMNYIDLMEEAVRDGELDESVLDAACERILAMKEKYGLFDESKLPHPTDELQKEIKDTIHDVSKAISEKGISLCANRTGFLPVKKENIKKVKIVFIGYSDKCYENLEKHAVEEFAAHGAICDIQKGFYKEDNIPLAEGKYDLIVYATFIGMWRPTGAPFFFEDECRAMRRIMTVDPEKSIGVSFGNTDIFFNYFTAAHTFINAYSTNPETIRSFVRGLYGEVQFTDFHPFVLNPISRTNDVFARGLK